MSEHGAEKVPAPLNVGDVTGGLVPRDVESLWRMAQMVLRSGMAPKDLDSAEKIAGAIGMGMEVGLSPFQAITSIAVINGRGCIWGDAMLGLVSASSKLEDITEEAMLDAGGAIIGYRCRVKRFGRSWHTVEYTVADAKLAKLWGKISSSGKPTPWVTSPARMLQMRARGFALRDVFPDVLKGLISREEARDYPAPERAEVVGAPSAADLTEALKRGALPAPVGVEAPPPETCDGSGFIPVPGTEEARSCAGCAACREELVLSPTVGAAPEQGGGE
jgi:hypothetical protein